MITMRYGVGSEKEEPCPLPTEAARRMGLSRNRARAMGGAGARTAGAAA